ncbi:hypothetical protein BST81_20635 [Leptolyngbya sp. 'hensonii']|uniref:filament integrity protein FraC n=1 Tax=Leptolyngbya sp. 'hensonii' TaxID=1922337 RepID=UPI00095B0EAE|nr:filament integrity protein FraC [Leptolyngbya sp. 'hensonii']OLP16606.1 hypothetical protein BST81_20635 [Leptolyngbya sp. 'hensonii']
MFPTILPIRAILFQLLFLFSSTLIEAAILHQRLLFSRKVAIEYAASLNLLSTFMGWLAFFEVQALLPVEMKVQLISYILYDQPFPGPWASSVNSFLILSGLLTFFCTVFVELTSLTLLDILLEKKKLKDLNETKINRYRDKQLRTEAADATRNRTLTMLLANACSYGLILLVLLLRAVG